MRLGGFVCQFLAQCGEVAGLNEADISTRILLSILYCTKEIGNIQSQLPQRGRAAVRHSYVSPHLEKAPDQ